MSKYVDISSYESYVLRFRWVLPFRFSVRIFASIHPPKGFRFHTESKSKTTRGKGEEWVGKTPRRPQTLHSFFEGPGPKFEKKVETGNGLRPVEAFSCENRKKWRVSGKRRFPRSGNPARKLRASFSLSARGNSRRRPTPLPAELIMLPVSFFFLCSAFLFLLSFCFDLLPFSFFCLLSSLFVLRSPSLLSFFLLFSFPSLFSFLFLLFLSLSLPFSPFLALFLALFLAIFLALFLSLSLFLSYFSFFLAFFFSCRKVSLASLSR